MHERTRISVGTPETYNGGDGMSARNGFDHRGKKWMRQFGDNMTETCELHKRFSNVLELSTGCEIVRERVAGCWRYCLCTMSR
jgi:hypothetical protein